MLAVAGGILAAVVAQPARAAQNDTTGDTASMVARAELIFEGTVAQVQYKNASSPSGRLIPHTFVTWEIHQVFKGKLPDPGSDRVTLRFIGGPTGDGRILTVDGVPLFDLGDRDILFVRKNLKGLCPLVDWENGRFRLVGGWAYTNSGRAVILKGNERFRLGVRRELAETAMHQVGSRTLRVAHSRAGKPEDGSSEASVGERRLDADGLRTHVAERVAAVHTASELAALPPVESADIGLDFAAPLFRPAKPVAR